MLFKRGAYYGVDILEQNITYAKKRYDKNAFFLSNGRTIPFADSYFDEAHLYDVLEHVQDMETCLEEIDRILAPGGEIFITVPAKISEDVLLRIKPDYFKEVGHMRIVDISELQTFFSGHTYTVETIKKVRGMEAVVLSLMFFFKKRRRVVEYQTGSPTFSKWLVALIWVFDDRLFRTKLRYLFPIYIFTLLIGFFISKLFPKSIYIIAKKYA